MKDLSTLIVENGHSNSNNLVLKIDIEGYEWDVFDKINVEDLKRFTQIVCEFHRMDQLAWVDKIDVFERVIQKLSLYFNVIHMHANNVGWLVDVDYVKVPVLLEISFVRNDLVKKFDIINTLRSDLDYENNPDASALDISNLWQQELKND